MESKIKSSGDGAIAIGMTPYLVPTNEFRQLKRIGEDGLILQQKFKILKGGRLFEEFLGYEWKDVPVVEE